ncbi:hypothetical protein BH10PLA2_BH10PLA2_02820 [soil metagenome]
MVASALLLLCSAAICPEPLFTSAPAYSIQNKDGLEQYPGNLEINVGAILKVEAFKTLFRKMGDALLRPITEEDRLELKAKFWAPYQFGLTRVNIGTKSHWQEDILFFESVVVGSMVGHIGGTLRFPPDIATLMYMEIEASTTDVKIDQKVVKQPKLMGGIELRLVLKKTPNDQTALGIYAITTPYRFTLPPHGKKALWGRCIWNYFADSFWLY